jgi:hypothetical protein
MRKIPTVGQFLAPFTKKFTNYISIEKGYEILCKDGTLRKIHDIKLVLIAYEYKQVEASMRFEFPSLIEHFLFQKFQINLYVFLLRKNGYWSSMHLIS